MTYAEKKRLILKTKGLNIPIQIPFVLCDNNDDPLKITTAHGQGLIRLVGVNTDMFRKEKTCKEIEEEAEDEYESEFYLGAEKIKE